MNPLAGPIEVFHLLLLAALPPRPGQHFAVLKGGGNLRFFQASPRYSQDLDFDVPDASVEDVAAAVERAVAGRPLRDGLRASGITIAALTPGKQSDTTQRWTIEIRVQLAVAGAATQPARTKIEFSGRPEALDYLDEIALDFVPDERTAPHNLRPPQVRHYLPSAAVVQKLRALSDRSEVQARDVWDLDWLFQKHPGIDVRGRLVDRVLDVAHSRVFEIDYGAYRAQVVAFMEDEYAEQLDSEAEWERIQVTVADVIERARGRG